jgi:hypothetical protein
LPGRKIKQKPGVPVTENEYKTPQLLVNFKRIIDKLNQEVGKSK